MREWQRCHPPMEHLLHCICKVDMPLMNHYGHIHTHNHFSTHGQKYTRRCIVYNVCNLTGQDNVKCFLTLPSHSQLLISSCVLAMYDCRLDNPHNPVDTVVILTARNQQRMRFQQHNRKSNTERPVPPCCFLSLYMQEHLNLTGYVDKSF